MNSWNYSQRILSNKFLWKSFIMKLHCRYSVWSPLPSDSCPGTVVPYKWKWQLNQNHSLLHQRNSGNYPENPCGGFVFQYICRFKVTYNLNYTGVRIEESGSFTAFSIRMFQKTLLNCAPARLTHSWYEPTCLTNY